MSPLAPETFASVLLGWRDQYGRKDLPWQQDPSPYRVWVSEIMLQQTQVGVVIPYFQRFTQALPNIACLASTDVDHVLSLWSGLGYYARARNLHRAAQQILDRHGGIFPTRIEEVLELPGIGRSTAGAILSLALGQRHPILDGNVKRVLCRCFGIEGWPGDRAVLTRLWRLAETCTPSERVAAYNQGIMDLGATLCSRSRPHCERCPMAPQCVARAQGRQASLPASRPRRALPTRSTLMLLAINQAGEVLMERRPPAGIWGGLWSLPEADPELGPAAWCQARLNLRPQRVEMLQARRHTFSHYSLQIQVAAIRLEATAAHIADRDDQAWLALEDARSRGVPAPVKRILDEQAAAIG